MHGRVQGEEGGQSNRWAALLPQILEVDPLVCPACHGALRIVAFITERTVIDQILTHLRSRAATAAHADARSPPSTRRRGAARLPTATPDQTAPEARQRGTRPPDAHPPVLAGSAITPYT